LVTHGFEGAVLMSLFWIVLRQLADIEEAMVTISSSSFDYMFQ